jgi:hypothetical protein
MRKLLTIITISAFSNAIFAQTDIKWLNLSLWNPVATVPYTYDNSVATTIGLLKSTVNNSYGFNINGLSGITTGKMDGLQIAGVYSRVEGAAKGLTVSGFYNFHKASMSGVEIGGLVNMNLVNQNGVQLSVVQNICMFNSNGLQMASLMNITGEAMSGVQLSAGFNVASVSRGVQASGIVNFALEESRGVQIAGFNYSTSMRGVQLGAANFARRMKGVQVGIVNYSADTSTVKIGLVSVSPKTKIRPIIYYSNLATLNIGFRFMNRISYSILGIGTPYEAPHSTSSGLFFYRLGIYRKVGIFTFSSDAGTSFITQYTETGEKDAVSIEGRMNVEVALTKYISLIGSGGYSVRKFFENNAPADMKPIAEFGIILPNLLKTKK